MIYRSCGKEDPDTRDMAPSTTVDSGTDTGTHLYFRKEGEKMFLKTFSFQTTGVGSIVLDDDATNKEIGEAMLLNATEEHGNGKGMPRKVKEEHDG